MRPRLRLFYSALMCSFVPYLAREAYVYFSPQYGLPSLETMTWTPHLGLGALCGAAISWLTLTSKAAFVIGGAFIGTSHAAFYLILLNTMTRQPSEEVKSLY